MGDGLFKVSSLAGNPSFDTIQKVTTALGTGFAKDSKRA